MCVVGTSLTPVSVSGVTHNIPLLRDIVMESRFRSGNITTKYLPETYPDGFRGAILTEKETKQLAAIGAALYARHKERSFKFLNTPLSATWNAQAITETSLSVSVPHLDDRKASHHTVDTSFKSGNLIQVSRKKLERESFENFVLAI